MTPMDGMTRSESNQLESPLSNGSSGQASPMEGSFCPGEEELVYGSYIGRKRKLKLNRKCNVHDESLMSPELSESTIENRIDPLLENASSPPVATDDFLEELKRKDQLLAELLNLDQIINSPSEQVPTEEEQILEAEVAAILLNSETKDISPVTEDFSSVVEEVENDPKENIYSIYASEDSHDKSLPYSISTPTTTESTPNHTAVSSGDYENVSSVTCNISFLNLKNVIYNYIFYICRMICQRNGLYVRWMLNAR
jgi:hypothetical protein